MENICQYCHGPFAFQRSTRKYCGNSCRQMDYYKRKKDFTLAGFFQAGNDFSVKPKELSVKRFTVKSENVKQEELSVKSFTLRPDNVKQKELSVKDTVKECVKECAGLGNISEEQLSALADKLFARLEKRIDEIIYRKNGFVKEDPLSVKDTVKKEVYDGEDGVKDSLSVKDTVEKEFYDKGGGVKQDSVEKVGEQYKVIPSRFVCQIAHHINKNNSKALFKFAYPHRFWTTAYIDKVKWVSLRFRCLVESLIEFCRFRNVWGKDLQGVAEAFSTLENSRHFKELKEDYPHKELICDWSAKINALATAKKGIDEVRFFISPENKAKLMATNYELSALVPRINFSQLDFAEME